MTPVTEKFPLLKLPFLAWRHVLQTMEPIEMITATFCSKRMKQRICTLKKKKHTFDITFGKKEIEISIQYNPTNVLEFAVCKNDDLYKLRSGEVSSSFNCSWELLVVRLMEMLKCQGVNLSFWYQNGNFVIEDIVDAFNGLSVGSIFSRKSPELYARKMMEAHPNVEDINLDIRPDMELLALKEIFSNTLHEEITLFCPAYLHDIMVMSAKNILLWYVRMNDEAMNDILTLWISGKWNPGLKYMMVKMIRNERVFNPALINGLETELVHEENGDFNDRTSFKREFLLMSDGQTKAKLSFSRYGGVLDCYLNAKV